jgi:hypothetical protein
MNAHRVALCAAVACAFAFPACTGGTRDRRSRSARGDASPETSSPDRSGEVFVSDKDLAPMDEWIKRRRWVLGDEIEIDASKEYFSQNVSIAARTGIVQQELTESHGVTTTVLTFVGRPEDLDMTSAPRVLVGLGLTASARRRLVLRLHKTVNPDLPVRFRLVARGKASGGIGDRVLQRADELGAGATIRRVDGRYVFEEQ